MVGGANYGGGGTGEGLAEGEGFEPSRRLTAYAISSRAH
jgi:hypothetical protein